MNLLSIPIGPAIVILMASVTIGILLGGFFGLKFYRYYMKLYGVDKTKERV
jgi:hypothetical protein